MKKSEVLKVEIYLNPGNELFKEAANSEIYVDTAIPV
jgi:hypothetical protein